MRIFRNPEVLKTAIAAAVLTVLFSCAMLAFSPWAALLTLAACLSLCGLFFAVTVRRYRNIAELTERIDRILHGADDVTVSDSAEGELSLLASEMRKMTVRLREQADYLTRDRLRMSDSLADIPTSSARR